MASNPDGIAPAPILVLGVGNQLLHDDGVGLVLLDRLSTRYGHLGPERIEFVDGGTQGLALLGLLECRCHVLVLDAVARGAAPGTLHTFDALASSARAPATTAHESSVAGLLDAARLVGTLPPEVRLVGIEPANLCTGIGLSGAVEGALNHALAEAARWIDQWEKLRWGVPCTN